MFRKPEASLKMFLEDFWFAPADVFLRATEALIWQGQKFKRPVLDIGCGDGQISKHIYKGKTIDVGIDLDELGVRKAQACGIYKKTLVADATSLPFGNESFSTVISNSTLEHIKDDIRAVGEASRVLKKEGLFLFTVPTARLECLLLKLTKDKKELLSFNRRVSHFHYRSKGEWKKLLSENNLKVVQMYSYFPEIAVRVWLRLFKAATFKIRGRELWSYLRDSRFSKLMPRKILVFLLEKYLLRYYNNRLLSPQGCWLFVLAQKEK